MPKGQQLVVYKGPSPKRGKKQRKGGRQPMRMIVHQKPKKRTSQRPSMNSAVRQFRHALRFPFTAEALGARVIDSICYPTTCAHYRYKATCTTSATGTFQIALLPFLHANSVLIAGTTTGHPGFYAGNTSISFVDTPANLKSKFLQYRVVSWGARIILTDSNLSAKGTYTVAPIPLGGVVPDDTVCGNTAINTGAILTAFGVTTPNEAIASMPGALALNAQDLMAKGELVMRGLAYAPTAYDFKTVANSGVNWAATQTFMQGGILLNGALTVQTAATTAMGDARGQLGYLLSVANAPNSTSEFQLEFIYHIEGIPTPSTGVVMTSTPSPTGSTSAVENILAAMHTAGEYFDVGTQLMNGAGALGTRMYRLNRASRFLLN